MEACCFHETRPYLVCVLRLKGGRSGYYRRDAQVCRFRDGQGKTPLEAKPFQEVTRAFL